ncbi:MAG TPA: hypothetical protein VMB84_11810, partial [Stellaceae bacterium]|nr:hypothetical protein [Stellaceae bacterium]
CGSQIGRPRSSFTAAGRGGVTQDPDDTLPALYLAGRDLAAAPTRAAAIGGALSALRLPRLAASCS